LVLIYFKNATKVIYNYVSYNILKQQMTLNFNDFHKQDVKFDIAKLQESYKEIIKTKKFEDAGVTNFGAISLAG